jgi:hypothetical protein
VHEARLQRTKEPKLSENTKNVGSSPKQQILSFLTRFFFFFFFFFFVVLQTARDAGQSHAAKNDTSARHAQSAPFKAVTVMHLGIRKNKKKKKKKVFARTRTHNAEKKKKKKKSCSLTIFQ